MNLRFSKKEEFLPRHMRLGWINRAIRFLFGPLCLLSILCLLYYRQEYLEIFEACANRNDCFAHCVNDNFPNLACRDMNTSITYKGNTYTQMYLYPYANSSNYNSCLGLVSDVSPLIIHSLPLLLTAASRTRTPSTLRTSPGDSG